MKSATIIGNGVVGSSWGKALASKGVQIAYLDDVESKSTVDSELSPIGFDTAAKKECVFICIPTPECGNGLDYQALVVILEKLSNAGYRGPVVIRSTLLPGVTQRLQNDFLELPLIHMPCFITERTADIDAQHPTGFVVGYTDVSVMCIIEFVHAIYTMFPCPINCMDTTSAELVKILSNAFYAAKVSLFNEFKGICDLSGGHWDSVVNGMFVNQWINPMHTDVPGPDGLPGWGGKCFPKDLKALLRYCHSLNGMQTPILGSVLVRNTFIDRPSNMPQPNKD